MYTYRVAGLAICSEFKLPGAIPAPMTGVADIYIRRRPVPDRLVDATVRGVVWEIAGASFLLQLEGIGRILASDGRILDVESAAGADPMDIVPFVLSTGLGVLLHQRGGLVLHAAAVAFGGRAYGFCGPSGIGKSTLAAALCQSGCDFVVDDLALVSVDFHGYPVLWPDGRQMKLFDNSIRHLGLEARRGGSVRKALAKYFVAPRDLATSFDSVPVAALYVMRDLEPPHRRGIEQLSTIDAAQILFNQSYRRRLALALARSGNNQQVAATAAVLRQVPVFRLTRPRNLDQLGAVVAELYGHWEGASD